MGDDGVGIWEEGGGGCAVFGRGLDSGVGIDGGGLFEERFAQGDEVAAFGRCEEVGDVDHEGVVGEDFDVRVGWKVGCCCC